tara:strand:+ start:641 stop:1948 length:1308 start_codon:yes stop_codon:yes gene_type:complete
MGGNFPLYLLSQLTGIENLYANLFSTLGILTFIKNGISLNIKKEDFIFFIFISYILIYFLVINGGLDDRWLNYAIDLLKRALAPYILGRMIYKHINFKFYKFIFILSIIFIFCLFYFFTLDPQGFFEPRISINKFKESGFFSCDCKEPFISSGLTFFALSIVSFFKIKEKPKIIFLNNKSIIFLFSLLSLLIIQITNRRNLIAFGLILITDNFKTIRKYFQLKRPIKDLPKVYLYILPIILGTIFFIIIRFNYNRFLHLSELNQITRIFEDSQAICNQIRDYTDYNSILQRISYIQSSFSVIKDNFFFGVGPLNLKNYICAQDIKIIKDILVHNLENEVHPHNIFLHIFTELGFIGFSLFVLNIFLIFNQIRRTLLNTDHMLSHIDKLLFLLWKFQLIVATMAHAYNNFFFLALTTGICTSIANKNRKNIKFNTI